MKTIDAEENKKRIEAEKEARLKSETVSSKKSGGEITGQEVISEIEEFLAELKKRAQFAYPTTGSE